MCGVCAEIGFEYCVNYVLKGLKKLEYRGYDSSGIAFVSEGGLNVVKAVGEIKNLENKLPQNLMAKVAIGHTRWATHGKVCEENAHPQVSFDKNFAMVHNGIIENFKDLQDKYLQETNLLSQTDTEILLNVIALQSGKTIEKLINGCALASGSFAVCMIEKGQNKIWIGKRKSPLMIAKNKDSCVIASDISVFAGRFCECFILNDDEFAEVEKGKITFYDKNCKQVKKASVSIQNFDFGEEKLNEKYFMLKEIKEQPVILKRTFFKYFSEEVLSNHDFEKLSKFKSFHFVACGTAYHACLMGAQFIQKFCGKKCDVSIASEFRYCDNVFDKNCLYVFVSQSGETADTIACVNLIKEKECTSMCVTNVPYCSLNKLADFVLPTFAGKEIAVASTKAYTAQVFTLLIFALKISRNKKLQQTLKKFVLNFDIQDFDEGLFKELFNFRQIFFIGRTQDSVTSLEAALKLKEIAYINCLGIPAGELKHGSLALVDDKTLVVVILTQKDLKEKIESNIQEVRARGGKVLFVSNLKPNVEVDFALPLADFEECLMPIVSIVPLQLFAMKFSIKKGFNPDKPRNLAKSVTVE